MKFLAIFLVILSVFNMMMVEANESTQKPRQPLNRRRRPQNFRADEGAWPNNEGPIIWVGSPPRTVNGKLIPGSTRLITQKPQQRRLMGY
ncbi:hypothetical protein GCK72_015914 [Caenorhabditis remanei]|uniref:Uncharacterized protein n=1 Tax=Caenorhabditis remanei TaxID=31234 RepID=A0A6A5GWA7_CAERE|nr:hypothetical protein GCK72_015914 [Caenorhabditis remanei]KAF1759447.1 hypothetical protein GCK72_015914 [Caenorhabditis remanei]